MMQKVRYLNLPSTNFQLLMQDLYSSGPKQAQLGHIYHFQEYQTVEEENAKIVEHHLFEMDM